MIGHLTEDEYNQIQQALDRCRTPETLVRGKWSVSPLNRNPEVVGNLPASVTLRDISLRTIDQTAGTWLTQTQRRSLAEALVDVGIRSFQVGWMVFKDAKALRDDVAFLKSLRPGIETTVTAATRAQADLAAEAGVDTFCSYAPSVWEFNMIYGTYGRLILRSHARGEDWRRTVRYPRSEDEQLEFLADDVSYAKSLGMRGCMASSMLHYATVPYIRHFAQAAVDCNADEVRVNDGASGLSPAAWQHLVSQVRSVAPDPALAVHTHNAFGLAGANALAAVSGGATTVEVSPNHVCGATGQADLAEVAAALEVLYGIDTGIDLTRLTHLSRLVEDLTGAKLSPNHPITGTRAFEYAEEAIAEEEKFAPVHKSVSADLFGNRATWVMGRYSGVDARRQLEKSLRERGVELSDEQFALLMERLQRDVESRHSAPTPDELADEAMLVLTGRSFQATAHSGK